MSNGSRLSTFEQIQRLNSSPLPRGLILLHQKEQRCSVFLDQNPAGSSHRSYPETIPLGYMGHFKNKFVSLNGSFVVMVDAGVWHLIELEFFDKALDEKADRGGHGLL